MKKVKYVRVSTIEQNEVRQTENWNKSDLYIDKVSGSVAFNNRPAGMKLLKDIEKGLINEVVVHSIDRLGRNLKDILNTIDLFNQHEVNLTSEKEGFQTFINGKPNPLANLLIGVLGSIAQMERERITERTREGVAIATKQGKYKLNGGTKPRLTNEEILIKHKAIVKQLKKGHSLREAAAFCKVSINTVRKVNDLL